MARFNSPGTNMAVDCRFSRHPTAPVVALTGLHQCPCWAAAIKETRRDADSKRARRPAVDPNKASNCEKPETSSAAISVPLVRIGSSATKGIRENSVSRFVNSRLQLRSKDTCLDAITNRFIGDMNDSLANFGYAVVGIFIVSWVVSMVIYRARDYDRLLQG